MPSSIPFSPVIFPTSFDRRCGIEVLKAMLEANKPFIGHSLIKRTRNVHALIISCSNPQHRFIGEGGYLGRDTPLRASYIRLPLAVMDYYELDSAELSLSHHNPEVMIYLPSDHMGEVLRSSSDLMRAGYFTLYNLYKIRELMFESFLKRPFVQQRIDEGLVVVKGRIDEKRRLMVVDRVIGRDVDLSGEKANTLCWAKVFGDHPCSELEGGWKTLCEVLSENYKAHAQPPRQQLPPCFVELACIDPRIIGSYFMDDAWGLRGVRLKSPGAGITPAIMEALKFSAVTRGVPLVVLSPHTSCAMHNQATGSCSQDTPLLSAVYNRRGEAWEEFLSDPKIKDRIRNGKLVCAVLELDLHNSALTLKQISCSAGLSEKARAFGLLPDLEVRVV